MIRTTILLCSLLLTGACVPSSVVAVEEREVIPMVDTIVWRDATEADIPGLYQSLSITGEGTSALLKIYYLFGEDHTFTAAALLATGTGPEFTVLTGTWQFEPGVLRLDDADPAELSASDAGQLRMGGDEGVVVLTKDVMR